MQEKLYLSPKRILFAFLFFTQFFGSDSNAQTTLSQGDISFTAFNANGTKGFAFVTWVTLTTGTEIRFTDNGFNAAAASSGSHATGGIRWQEQYAVWTATSEVAPGTVITCAAEVASTGTVAVFNADGSTTPTALSLSNSQGDQIFAYQGSATITAGINATFPANNVLLAGINYQSTSTTANLGWLTTGTTGAQNSYLPSDLTSNYFYFGGQTQASQYFGTRDGGTLTSYKAAVGNISNWSSVIGSNTVTYNTTAFALGTAPSISSQPSNSTICAGGNTTFSVTASNATAYQWKVSTDGGGSFNNVSGGVYSDATTATLTITGATAGMSGYQFQCVVTGTASPAATSSNVLLTVNTAPAITGSPSGSTICSGSNTSFSAAASNASGYQWQVNTGFGFSNLSNGGVYSGATTTTLNITGATADMDGYAYRCIATGLCSPNAVSTGAPLTVSPNVTYFEDFDNDGFGNGAVTIASCSGAPSGYVTNGDDCDDNDASVYPGQSVWKGTTNTLWSEPSNWSCGTLPTATSNVRINSAANMPVVDITTAACNDLTIGSGASLTINSGMILNIKGTVANSGSFSAVGKTAFSGDSQTLPGGSFTDLEIAGTGTKTLSGAATVSGTLTLTASNLQLGNNDLTVGSAGSVTGGSASHYIVINGSGKLKQQGIGAGGRTGEVVFPIGTSSSYTPLSVTNAGTADEFSVRVINNIFDTYNSSDTPTGTAQSDNNVDKTWMVTEAVPGGSNVTLSFQWNASDELPGFNRSACFPAHYKNFWQSASVRAATGSNPYQTTMSGITSFSPFGIGSSSSILPLKLVSFTAKEVTDGITLQWTTSDEVNTAAFDIERAAHGGNFVTINSVPAGTNGNYSYTDNGAVAGWSYFYRLKMRDKDGQSTYSPTISIKYQAKATTGYSVYPNPLTGPYLYIKPATASNEPVKIEVADFAGRTWYSHSFTSRELSNGRYEILVKQLPAGSYVVRISDKNGNSLQVTKFIVSD